MYVLLISSAAFLFISVHLLDKIFLLLSFIF